MNKRLRLHDLVKGQVYLMNDTYRICRVGEATQIEVTIDERLQMLPAKFVYVTLPIEPIDGHVTPQKAAETRVCYNNIASDNPTTGPDDTNWQEIWAERLVPSVEWTKPPKIRQDKPIPQLYVHAELGKLGVRKPNDGMFGMAAKGQVDGNLIPAELVPAGTFRDWPYEEPFVARALPKEASNFGDGLIAAMKDGLPEPFVNPAKHVTIGTDDPLVEAGLVEAGHKDGRTEPRMTIGRARKLAKDKGIDISDISGKGALAKILERVG